MDNKIPLHTHYWKTNSSFLPEPLRSRLESIPDTISDSCPGNNPQIHHYAIESAKNGHPILCVDGIYLHSRHDPQKESRRLAEELPSDNTERIFLFLGAGLGYIVQEALRTRESILGVWMEQDPIVLKMALTYLDFSDLFQEHKLQILLAPIQESDLYKTFQGRSTVPASLVPHRGSLIWQEKEYTKLRYLGESFFHKKDVNLATLVRFEKIWTKNILQNLTEIPRFHPVSRVFGIGQSIPVLVVGAGPSLQKSLPYIQAHRKYFAIIAVDTALQVLSVGGVHPDLVYSVDPQMINHYYLEGYQGSTALVLDPTSTYLTPRLLCGPLPGFFTTTPFPLTRMLQEITEEEIGSIPFGGSVSTNAVSLARLMEFSEIYMVGQDLAFTDGLAHSKGAVLEERLKWRESRRFRGELHNHRQLTALPKHWEQSLDGKKVQTNEKLILFRNWFSENCPDVFNLTDSGMEIPNLKKAHWANLIPKDEGKRLQAVSSFRSKLQAITTQPANWCNPQALKSALEQLLCELDSYRELVEQGHKISQEIYNAIQTEKTEKTERSEQIFRDYIRPRLTEMDRIDEAVSSRKNLGEILSTSMQRVIFSVTEGFDGHLTLEEKENPRLGIAKKSLLLYNGLLETSKMLRNGIVRTLLRMNEIRPEKSPKSV